MFSQSSSRPNRRDRCMAARAAYRGVAVCTLLCSAGSGQELELDEDAATDNAQPGLIAVYRDSVQTVSRVDSRLAFLLADSESPHPIIDSTGWEADWNGAIDIREPGRYRFAAEVQGEFELTVAGQTVLTAESEGANEPVRLDGTPIDLPFGPATIRAHYRKGTERGAVLRLLMRRPDGFEESVLPRSFQHAPADESDLLIAGRQFDLGRKLLARYACVACHQWDRASTERLGIEPIRPGRYAEAIPNVTGAWLDAWMRNPKRMRIDARMPRLFGDEPMERIDLAATLAVLESFGPDRTGTHSAVGGHGQLDKNAPDGAAGRAEFASTGCAACHALPGDPTSVADSVRRLDDVDEKYSRASLRTFLFGDRDEAGSQRAAARHRPELDMSGLAPAQRESLLEVLFAKGLAGVRNSLAEQDLLGPSEAAVNERFRELVTDDAEGQTFERLAAPERLIQLGKVVIQRRGCARCHRDPEHAENKQEIPSFEVLVAEASQMASSQVLPAGCLSESPSPGVPDFGLTADKRTAIVATLRQLATRRSTWGSPPDRLQRELTRLGCVACHTRGERQSRFLEQALQFVALGPDQQPLDIAPPPLNGVGERLRPEWLHAVLVEHRRVRPWLSVKMPRYERAEVEPLVKLLTRSDRLKSQSASPNEPPRSQLSSQAGRKIVGPTGLNCIGCHDFVEHVPTGGVRAPDLTTAPERLRFTWFRRWLHDPQSITPGTRMPSNFRNGRSALATVLDGSEAAQVDALWGYFSDPDRDPPLLKPSLATIGEADTPVPTDRPLLVHGFMPGHAGLRGIALGFPDGVHFAFDSETCSVRRVWTGQFLHHEGWTDSGKGDVTANAITILGDILWRDDGEQPVRFLSFEDASEPASHRFVECWAMRSDAGFAWEMRLDRGQRVRVEERPSPMPALGVSAFRRRLTIINAPFGSQVAIRASSNFSGLPSSDMPASEWVRLEQGSADWLVRRLSPSGSERWTVTSERPESASSDVRELSLVTTAEGHSHIVELVYVRVPRGSEPPILHRELLSKEQQGAQP